MQAVEGDTESAEVSYWAGKELEKLLAQERAARAAIWHWGVSQCLALLLILGSMSVLRCLSAICGPPTCNAILGLAAHCVSVMNLNVKVFRVAFGFQGVRCWVIL